MMWAKESQLVANEQNQLFSAQMKMVDTHTSRLNTAWRGVMNISEVYLQTILEKAVRNAFPKTISLLSAEQRKHTERQNHQKTEK